MGYNTMTPIQAKSLPFILDGKDIIGQAKTGSGKTAAFGLGVLTKLDVKSPYVQALILCPTRELAEQVGTELRKLARMTPNIKILMICGGTNEWNQTKSLSHGAHVIVGTPGRVLKLLSTNKIDLDDLNTFVLDEADRMLDMGFSEDINKIMVYLPKERQSLLFSATFSPEIEKLSALLLKDATTIKVDVAHKENVIKQYFYEVETHNDKLKHLPQLLAEYQPKSTVVFCKTKQICDAVTASLVEIGISAISIHGDHEQKERVLALTKFSNGSCLVLVATDVAARGLDIKNLEAVINFDLTDDPEVYTHRIGRTGRQDNTGLALSLHVKPEAFKIDAIIDYQNSKPILKQASSLSAKKKFTLKPNMTTLYISRGRKDKIRPGDIVGTIVKTCDIDANVIGDITVLDIFTYVAVESHVADQVIRGLQNAAIKKMKVRVGRA